MGGLICTKNGLLLNSLPLLGLHLPGRCDILNIEFKSAQKVGQAPTFLLAKKIQNGGSGTDEDRIYGCPDTTFG